MGLPSPEVLQYQQKHRNDNRGPDIIVSLAIMLAMAYIAVGLRFLSRKMTRANLSYDDWVMVIGLVCHAGSSTFSCPWPLRTRFFLMPHRSLRPASLLEVLFVS